MLIYSVCNNENGMSIGEWFSKFSLGKSKINSLIANHKVFVNDLEIKNLSYVLKDSDQIIIDSIEDIDYPPMKYDLKVLYEDDYLLAVEKPKGIVIYPENKIKDDTLANYVAYYYSITNQSCNVRHLYRIDKDTSGIVLYAKDLLTLSSISKQIEECSVKKEYLTICKGKIEEDGMIEIGISRDRHNAKRMFASNKGQYSKTIYHVIKTKKDQTLLSVNIKTGRTHQIRVHFSYIHHPIIGDSLYDLNNNYDNLMLHCSKIGFYHPFLKQYMEIESDMPEYMKKYVREKL